MRVIQEKSISIDQKKVDQLILKKIIGKFNRKTQIKSNQSSKYVSII